MFSKIKKRKKTVAFQVFQQKIILASKGHSQALCHWQNLVWADCRLVFVSRNLVFGAKVQKENRKGPSQIREIGRGRSQLLHIGSWVRLHL
jgi:hypothetical protein